VSVGYVLGASGVRFPTFLAATVGLIPALFAEVYFGYVASHLTQVAVKALAAGEGESAADAEARDG
jgi:uncharacterized membrane protein YdjX (TVP38/TMEM64 family)